MSFWSHENLLLCEHFTDEQSTSRKLKYRTTLLKSSSSLNRFSLPGDNLWRHKWSDHGGHGGEAAGLGELGHLAPGHLQTVLRHWDHQSYDMTWGDITTDEMTDDISLHRWPPTPSLASLHRPISRGSGTDRWFLLFFDFFLLEFNDQSSELQLRLLSAWTSNVTGNMRKAAEI